MGQLLGYVDSWLFDSSIFKSLPNPKGFFPEKMPTYRRPEWTCKSQNFVVVNHCSGVEHNEASLIAQNVRNMYHSHQLTLYDGRFAIRPESRCGTIILPVGHKDSARLVVRLLPRRNEA